MCRLVLGRAGSALGLLLCLAAACSRRPLERVHVDGRVCVGPQAGIDSGERAAALAQVCSPLAAATVSVTLRDGSEVRARTDEGGRFQLTLTSVDATRMIVDAGREYQALSLAGDPAGLEFLHDGRNVLRVALPKVVCERPMGNASGAADSVPDEAPK